MTLPDDIGSLRDRVLIDLTSAHDYFTDTTFAWRIVREAIDAGREFQIRSLTTGTSTTQEDLASRAHRYVAEQLAEATFQQFISLFEEFYFDFLCLWLTAYPQSLGRKTVDFKVVLESPDKEAITQHVVKKELNEILYDRPTAWFAYLEDKVKLGCPSAGEIERIAEAKASRDILVHNRKIANRTYELKSGNLARFRDGERLDVPEPYHRETWELIRKVVGDVSDAAIARLA